jgi:hypothetical protein
MLVDGQQKRSGELQAHPSQARDRGNSKVEHNVRRASLPPQEAQYHPKRFLFLYCMSAVTLRIWILLACCAICLVLDNEDVLSQDKRINDGTRKSKRWYDMHACGSFLTPLLVQSFISSCSPPFAVLIQSNLAQFGQFLLHFIFSFNLFLLCLFQFLSCRSTSF